MTPSRLQPGLRALALALAVAAAACTPSDQKASALAAQAQQKLDSGQPFAAEALVQQALAARDDVPSVYLAQAHVANVLGRRDEAYQAYASVLALEATNPEALMGVAQTGLSTNHVDASDDAANKILVLDPHQSDALLIKGIVSLIHTNMDAAIAFADRVLAAKPGDPGGLILKSRALALRGDRAAALKLVQEGIKAKGETLELSMSLAELQRSAGDGPAFLATLRRLRALQPANRGYRFDLADTLYKLGKPDEARREVTSLLDEGIGKPTELEQFARLWYNYDRQALSPEQVAHAARHATLGPRVAAAHYFIATGQARTAFEIIAPTAQGWSQDVQALLARAQAQLGQAPAALATARQVLALDPNNGEALLITAAAKLAGSDPGGAVIDYQRVISDYPQWHEGYLGLARAYAAARKPEGVRRAFEDGRQALPQSLPLAEAYVAALPGLGDPGHALDVARQFALASPSSIKAWQLYAAVCGRSGDADCRGEAAEGLAGAHQRFGLDLPPGTPPPTSLIGRLP